MRGVWRMRHVCAACRQMGCEALRSKALVNAPKSSNFGRSRDIHSTRVPAVPNPHLKTVQCVDCSEPHLGCS